MRLSSLYSCLMIAALAASAQAAPFEFDSTAQAATTLTIDQMDRVTAGARGTQSLPTGSRSDGSSGTSNLSLDILQRLQQIQQRFPNLYNQAQYKAKLL
jgi:hypothetical protein